MILPSANTQDYYVYYPPQSQTTRKKVHGQWIVPCVKTRLDEVWILLQPTIDTFLVCNGMITHMKASTSRQSKYEHSVILISVAEAHTQVVTRANYLCVGHHLITVLKELEHFSPQNRMFYKTEGQSKGGTRASGIKSKNTLTSLMFAPQCVIDKSYPLPQVHNTHHKQDFVTGDAALIELGMVWNSTYKEWAVVDNTSLTKVIEHVSVTPPVIKCDKIVCMSINVWGIMDDVVSQCTAPLPERMKAIVHEIKQRCPDVLCLQEITVDVYHCLHTELCQAGYVAASNHTFQKNMFVTMVYFFTSTIKHTGTFTGVSLPEPHQHRMSRVFEFVHNVSDVKFCASTFHLPSGANNASLRLYCLSQLFHIMQTRCQNGWIALGDCNIPHKQDLDMPLVYPNWVSDAWESSKSRNANKRATYDPHLNANIKHLLYETPGCRFDRCFFGNAKWHLQAFNLVCLDPMPIYNKQPSDHFGILTSFCIYE